MDNSDQPPVSELLRSTAAIPIARLSPDVDRLSQSSIHSVVTLLWPYSSSTRTLSVLLAEPDFRLRRSNGQVKVFFHGHVAEEVARTHIGIGDTVYLSLTGSKLSKNDANAATQTPGRSVSWDVHFETSAFLEIWRNSKLLSTVKVDFSRSTPPLADNVTAAPSTPAAYGGAHAFGPPESSLWQSPAFLGGSWVSSHFTDSADDPFVEEDGYPESPGDRDLPEDWMAIFDEDLEKETETGVEAVVQDTPESTIAPAPAAVPDNAPAVDTDAVMVEADAASSAADKHFDQINDNALFIHPNAIPQSVSEPSKLINPGQASHLPTNTPRLHPVPSPGLPQPSPLTTTPNSLSGYFGSAANTPAAAQSMTPVAPSSNEGSESDGHVKPRTAAVPGSGEVAELNGPDTLPPDQPYDESFTPAPSKPEEETRLDNSDSVPQVQDHGGLTHTAEDDVVTVYTDDMQVLASDRVSALDSADAMASPQPSNRNATTVNDIELAKTEGNLGHFTKTSKTETHSEGPDSETGQHSAIDEDDAARRFVNESDQEDEDRVSGESMHERQGRENDIEQKQVSAERNAEGELSKARRLENFDIPRAEGESPSSDYSGDRSPNRSYDYDLEDESDGVDSDDIDDDDDDGSDEDASNQGELEEDYEDDEDDDEDDGYGEGYDYSESEIESVSEGESSPRAAPKNTAPEVIVLDSDSEDDLAAPLAAADPTDTANGQTQDTSGESSYDSEDHGPSGDGFSDEADHEREPIENQEGDDVGFSDRMAVHGTAEESGSSNAEGKGNQHIVNEHPVAGWQSEPERMEEDVHDDLATHQEEGFHVQQNMKAESTLAESSWEPNQNASVNEFVATHAYREDFQRVAEYPLAPKHDSLDYLAAISESAERLNAISEPAQPGHELAIDPSLYELGNPQGDNVKEPDTEQFERSVEDSKGPRSMHDRHLALQLDGAASETVAELTEIPVSAHETRQSIASGPSQLVVTDQAAASVKTSSPIEALEDTQPTLNLTQETLSILEAGDRPRTPTVVDRALALEGESPSPIVAVNSEPEGALIVKREGSEPEQPMVVVHNKIAPSPDEDQALQASIEVDDQSEDSIDETIRTPGDRHYPGLRSKLSYFAPLATLIDHYNALVDTISIVSEVNPPTKAGSGSKDFIMTLQLTDQSMAGASVYAQLLRPYKSALPTPSEGDAILLRNFRVKSFNHSVILVSDSTSAWAVFSSSTEGADIAGPPLEYGAEEEKYATGLRHWYLEDGVAMVADYQLQASVDRESRAETPASSLAHSDAGSIDMALRETRGDTSSSRGSRRRKSHRRITIHELRDGRRYTEVGSTPGEDSIHELRDGTLYANL
ncbi:hypothetical protein AN8205.2 [Aspergillus nidulans FGSC A4]|uniref:Telomeric single stranded DNA binding POT1/Cdc13 domain-containing protein n=1 Tax=Emericella nidulans (strain FGSC A4 / ATCC 38163 / CBS 112.46 / NRRL 194 / M139) TaxID=227321 RepID=Q5AU25_EMENI|nr:hypothetical protein [Aspergillus nidulans FGSC A4]EAA58849.1 hypothetical protein AN8205.2 [Aspergillus nidulans FGSC A4]CBF74106.1 TPA: conserved hypothetical protein [Aspergillus nidulans FGSC A4]|eukprot:XP_681474.1 hypothetical protein AN8205.2 [Aspergillus nidulans FGSC A4]